ncbi:hypothetical protein P152DRAFT_508107 [Eremomyces bilateralis CBS 781.70]|uniref:AAA+ ATPase domain-containing protein n=1 Tax=Eremomyces bilateralis CBS 781.70 TaxID=1392243 RepID=A0A6G1G0J5_9PEZI|nr:uncharacterized protein P152DRAFT_508107 [Eremomyces bilateralis CBS 781.70]KAF1811574.1 hypothetical protein P152DRAFT_508107 [Eremomyces bilateralis CBS 781.70]
MTISSSPYIPSSFDPALHLHSENLLPEVFHPVSSHSDEFEAIEQVRAEDIARKTASGIVIQHRAWKTCDAFRSDEDRPIRSPLRDVYDPTQLTSILIEDTDESQNTYRTVLPSSPPGVNRTTMSSPVLYPRSPTPTQQDMYSPRKRRRLEGSTSILTESPSKGNRLPDEISESRGPFLFSDDSDTEDGTFEVKSPATGNQENFVPIPLASAGKPLAAHHCSPRFNPVEFNDVTKFDSLASNTVSNPSSFTIRTSAGQTIYLPPRRISPTVSYQTEVALRSTTAPGHANKSYYGIEIHHLLDELAAESTSTPSKDSIDSSTTPSELLSSSRPGQKVQLWTEKYRAKSFTSLLGDERTHRRVLHWLKSWDPLVFSSSKRSSKQSSLRTKEPADLTRKILLLTGPPGLGKTTLAHVCGRHAGYEVQEINASDERSANVVKTRIKDMLGTENVRTATFSGQEQGRNGQMKPAAGKPVCIVVDEVDGAAASSGAGGESGFIKAILDLVALDQRNTLQPFSDAPAKKAKSRFRMRRPLILICNDLYATSLRLLRQSPAVEIIHVRPPPISAVATRLDTVFRKEGIAADSDAIRRICETIWSTESKKSARFNPANGDGDVRSIMVAAEWIARRWMAECTRPGLALNRLTKPWVEDAVVADFAAGGKGARAIGRTSARDVVNKIFTEHAGLSTMEINHLQGKIQPSASDRKGASGVSEGVKRGAFEKLRHVVEACGEVDRVVSDTFAAYPEHPYQDDTIFSKPTLAHEYLHFHDQISSRVHASHEWELGSYLSLAPLALHNLFAVPAAVASRNEAPLNHAPRGLNGTKDPSAQPGRFPGDHAEKEYAALLSHMESILPHPTSSTFRNNNLIVLELVPYLLRILSPGIKVVGVGGTKGATASFACVRKASEKAMLALSVNAALATGITFERVRIENTSAAEQDPDEKGEQLDQPTKSMAQAQANMGWVYRLQPAIDTLSNFDSLAYDGERVSFAVRRLLEEERRREESSRLLAMRKERMGPDNPEDAQPSAGLKAMLASIPTAAVEVSNAPLKDFFGRVIAQPSVSEPNRAAGGSANGTTNLPNTPGDLGMTDGFDVTDEDDVWLNYHEGFSRAVKKAVTLDEFLEAFTS